jgi:CO dehydrogenase nickel-insertion accessory protein CooC1
VVKQNKTQNQKMAFLDGEAGVKHISGKTKQTQNQKMAFLDGEAGVKHIRCRPWGLFRDCVICSL